MYTNRHPDLVAARRELERVEKTLKAAQEELAKAQTSTVAELLTRLRPIPWN